MNPRPTSTPRATPLRTMLTSLLVVLALCAACHAERSTDGSQGGADASASAPRLPASTVSLAVQGALAVEDPLQRAVTLGSVLEGLGPDAVDDVVDTWDAITDGGGEWSGAEVALVFEWWARHDPRAAYEYLLSHGRLKDRTLLRTVFRAWATRDPQAAAEAIPEQMLPMDRASLYRAVAEGWVASGEPGLVEYLIEMEPGGDRQSAIAGLARKLVRSEGIDATIRWVDALPDDAAHRFKLQAYRRVASAIAEVDPIRAAAWAESQLGGPFGDGLARRVCMIWVLREPEPAMTWLLGLPPDASEAAIEDTYRAWLRRDRLAALAWLRALDPGARPDPAVHLYALSTARDDPRGAIQWAEGTAAGEARDQTLEKVARVWLAVDRSEAEGWIRESDLPEDRRRRLLTTAPTDAQ